MCSRNELTPQIPVVNIEALHSTELNRVTFLGITSQFQKRKTDLRCKMIYFRYLIRNLYSQFQLIFKEQILLVLYSYSSIKAKLFS